MARHRATLSPSARSFSPSLSAVHVFSNRPINTTQLCWPLSPSHNLGSQRVCKKPPARSHVPHYLEPQTPVDCPFFLPLFAPLYPQLFSPDATSLVFLPCFVLCVILLILSSANLSSLSFFFLIPLPAKPAIGHIAPSGLFFFFFSSLLNSALPTASQTTSLYKNMK